METTSAEPDQTFVENWIVIQLCRNLKYFYFNISYKGKIDSLTPPGQNLTLQKAFVGFCVIKGREVKKANFRVT